MDIRLSKLPNRISTQDLTHRSRGDIHGQSPPARNLAEKKQLNCLLKVLPVDKGLNLFLFGLNSNIPHHENCFGLLEVPWYVLVTSRAIPPYFVFFKNSFLAN